MKILQINTTVNSGSTGRIAEDIGKLLLQNGHESFIAAAYANQKSQSEVIDIGSELNRKLHGLKSRLFDRHGFGSAKATLELIEKIRVIKPDIIHLHNIHGYYLHIGILFNFLKEEQMPVVWTFHDCWPFTGHCAYFDRYNCRKWETQCYNCPAIKAYPASWWIDNSRNNYNDKNQLFRGLNNLHIITPSRWLAKHVENSFLKDYPIRCIHNGIDLKTFNIVTQTENIAEKYKLPPKQILLGVASVWHKRKGLKDFILLSKLISKEAHIVLVGLTRKQIEDLPANITGIERTESVNDLASLYSKASIFLNPTYVDNFPTTNIESLACGTPVITYQTGGSPEAIEEDTGFVVGKGDIDGLYLAIQKTLRKGKLYYESACRARAERLFDKSARFDEYIDLYYQLLKIK